MILEPAGMFRGSATTECRSLFDRQAKLQDVHALREHCTIKSKRTGMFRALALPNTGHTFGPVSETPPIIEDDCIIKDDCSIEDDCSSHLVRISYHIREKKSIYPPRCLKPQGGPVKGDVPFCRRGTFPRESRSRFETVPGKPSVNVLRTLISFF